MQDVQRILDAFIAEKRRKLQEQKDAIKGNSKTAIKQRESITKQIASAKPPTFYTMLGSVIKRNADQSLISTPEGALILAVINQAVFDAESKAAIRMEARRFFTDGRLDRIAPLIGLDPQFVRELIARVSPWIKAS